jgi:hypothetical protein
MQSRPTTPGSDREPRDSTGPTIDMPSVFRGHLDGLAASTSKRDGLRRVVVWKDMRFAYTGFT